MPEEFEKPLVPPEFFLGLAVTGPGTEGGFNGPGQPEDNWVRWVHSGRPRRFGQGGRFWDRPEPVLDQAAAMGADTFALSVEWARLEPDEGSFDDRALERYALILDMCRQRGLAPVTTLHHGTHPWWLGEEFWLTPGAPDRFAGHVARVVPQLAASCRRWVTLQDPATVLREGWLQGTAPPGRRGAVADSWAVLDNLLTAHVLAHDVIHQAQPPAVVALGLGGGTLYDGHRLLVDLLSAPRLGVALGELDGWVDERRALHDLAFPPRNLAQLAVRRLAAASSPFGAVDPRPWRRHLRRPSPRRALKVVYAKPTVLALEAVVVEGTDPVTLAAWCREEQALAPGLALWVYGHGAPRDQLAVLVEALNSGAPVAGYLHGGPLDPADRYGRLIEGLRSGNRAVLADG